MVLCGLIKTTLFIYKLTVMKKTKVSISNKVRNFFVNLLFEPKFGKHAGIIFFACLIGCYCFYPDSENSLGNALIISYCGILIAYWAIVLSLNTETSQRVWEGIKIILLLLIFFSAVATFFSLISLFQVKGQNPPSVQVALKIILVYVLGFIISYALQDENAWRFRRMEKWRTRRLI